MNIICKKGTFGQSIPWNLYDPATYQHPLVPLDVLTDPKSLPKSQQTQIEEEEEKEREEKQKAKEKEKVIINFITESSYICS